LTNEKLLKRGVKMLIKLEGINEKDSMELLKNNGSVRKALIVWKKKK
jgi:N-acetylmuramic acid 6-phosphate (MurNAc-6-P) etherase